MSTDLVSNAHHPSMNINITSQNAKAFLEIVSALNTEKLDPDAFCKAALTSEHSSVVSFLDRTRASGLSQKELNIGILLFRENHRSEKIQEIFQSLSSITSEECLLVVCRAILNTLLCVSQESHVVIEGQPEGPPLKKSKRDEIPCQSPSFDSSLATLKDEEEAQMSKRDVDEVAQHVSSEAMKEAKDGKLTPEAFEAWYKKHSAEASWLEYLDISTWKTEASEGSSPGSLASEHGESPTLVSFDFSGSAHPTPLCINISEDNLLALKRFVERTKIMVLSTDDMSKRVRGLGDDRMKIDDLQKKIPTLITESVWTMLSKEEQQSFEQSLMDIFGCFRQMREDMASDEVSLKDFATGFGFFSSGRKSAKLMSGFNVLATDGKMNEDQLVHFVNSYLTMLVAISLLVPLSKQSSHKPLEEEQRKRIRTAVENGARWTIGHFLKDQSEKKESYCFEEFAMWYSAGGYNIAPWLELLDLSKILALVDPNDSPIQAPKNEFVTTAKRPSVRDRVSSLRRHHSRRLGPPPEILFNFPLAAGHRSLIVLKEDAAYVRGIVEKLGILNMSTDAVWSALSAAVNKRNPKTQGGTVYVDMKIFVEAMQEICPSNNRKRSVPGASTASLEELLSNFFQCFDLDQVNQVALDELMGGIALLCGGKKSSKLAFAFSIFDTRPASKKKPQETPTLCGEDLFLFLRSILIVTFSCCRQSLDMDDGMVARCIADTSNIICNDVMRHQWEKTQRDRLNFDEFGQWYNDGGFERAPWLELLDLKKWVMIGAVKSAKDADDPTVPPPPPEEELDAAFFDDGHIMNMDSMDDMDMILMQNSMEHSPKLRLANSFSFSPKQQYHASPKSVGNPLKFHLITNHEHGGYMLVLNNSRIQKLARLLSTCATHEVDVETACNAIMSRASRGNDPRISKTDFESVTRETLLKRSRTSADARLLTDLYSQVFDAFDRNHSDKASAIELACGVSLLCKGKKSDKLEFAFDVLDKKKTGRLSDSDLIKYMQSFLLTLMTMTYSERLYPDARQDSISTLNGKKCEKTSETFARISFAGAEWASHLAFEALNNAKSGKGRPTKTISFDDFGSWYTKEGYRNIPWLELLDLKKWVFAADATQLPTF